MSTERCEYKSTNIIAYVKTQKNKKHICISTELKLISVAYVVFILSLTMWFIFEHSLNAPTTMNGSFLLK